jgi:hypothetical protein
MICLSRSLGPRLVLDVYVLVPRGGPVVLPGVDRQIAWDRRPRVAQQHCELVQSGIDEPVEVRAAPGGGRHQALIAKGPQMLRDQGLVQTGDLLQLAHRTPSP